MRGKLWKLVDDVAGVMSQVWTRSNYTTSSLRDTRWLLTMLRRWRHLANALENYYTNNRTLNTGSWLGKQFPKWFGKNRIAVLLQNVFVRCVRWQAHSPAVRILPWAETGPLESTPSRRDLDPSNIWFLAWVTLFSTVSRSVQPFFTVHRICV